MYPAHEVDMPFIPPDYLENQHLVFQNLRHFKRIATPIPEDRVRRARAAYYGMITELDEYVGQIWNELERTGQLEDTIFIYTSDHGESLGEHGLWYKNNLYDNAANIPLVIAGPGIPRGRSVDTPVAHVDLAYTILELAGAQTSVETAMPLRGHSLLPLMHGKTGDHPGFAYSESHSEGNCTGSFMIRKGDWKYIHFTWYDDLLFNVAEEPGEFSNLIDDPDVAEVRDELRDILHSQVNPEEVTRRAFQAQEDMLHSMSHRMTEDELFQVFRGRLGPGLARVIAAKCKSMSHKPGK
jgi:choline-sulfatase